MDETCYKISLLPGFWLLKSIDRDMFIDLVNGGIVSDFEEESDFFPEKKKTN